MGIYLMDLRKTKSDTHLHTKKSNKVTKKNKSEDDINYKISKKIYSEIKLYLSSLSSSKRKLQTPNKIILHLEKILKGIEVSRYKPDIKKWSREIFSELKSLEKKSKKS